MVKEWYLKIIYKVLASYAKKVIETHSPFVIAVTGSVGKSSAKEAIYKVLQDQYGDKVRANYGNLNAHLGVPLTILGYSAVPNRLTWPIFLIRAYLKTKVKKYPKYLVLELGIYKVGDMDDFMAIAKPDIAVITSLDGAHSENFATLSEYQKEKLKIIDYLKENGKIVLNYDEPELVKIVGPNVISVAVNNRKANFRIENSKVTLGGTEYRLETTGQKISIKSKLIGRQSIYSQLFAFAIANQFEFNFLKTKKSLEEIESYPGRMKLISGIRGISIIDDTYNSNPASVRAGLDALSSIITPRRKVAILGNMNELGDIEKDAHIDIAKYAADKCDFLVVVGHNAEIMHNNLKNKKKVIKFKSRAELLKSIDDIIESNDIVLVKASQNGNFFEEVVKYLLKDKKSASNLLVRQSRYWMGKKR